MGFKSDVTAYVTMIREYDERERRKRESIWDSIYDDDNYLAKDIRSTYYDSDPVNSSDLLDSSGHDNDWMSGHEGCWCEEE